MTTKTNPMTAMILVLVMAALAACDSTMAPPAGRRDTIALGSYPQIVPMDNLAPFLGFDEPIVEPSTPSRPMNVTVKVRSLVDYAISTQYRFIFYDQLGRELRSNLGWTYQPMEPRLQVQLKGQALETEAQQWRLEIRSAR